MVGGRLGSRAPQFPVSLLRELALKACKHGDICLCYEVIVIKPLRLHLCNFSTWTFRSAQQRLFFSLASLVSPEAQEWHSLIARASCSITMLDCVRQELVGRSRDREVPGRLPEVRSQAVRGGWRGAGLLAQGELCRDKKSDSGPGGCAGLCWEPCGTRCSVPPGDIIPWPAAHRCCWWWWWC